MILTDFLDRLKLEYRTLDKLNRHDYYPRLSSLFVVLELDGDNLNQEHRLGLDEILDRLNDINENELQTDLSQEELNTLVRKTKTGLAILINAIED